MSPPPFIVLYQNYTPRKYFPEDVKSFSFPNGTRYISAYHCVARSPDFLYFDEDQIPAQRVPGSAVPRLFFKVLLEGETVDLLVKYDERTRFLYSEKGDTAREMGIFERGDRIGGALDVTNHFYKDVLIFLAKKYGHHELTDQIQTSFYNLGDMISIFTELNFGMPGIRYRQEIPASKPNRNDYVAIGFGYTELTPVPPAKWLEYYFEQASLAVSVSYGRLFTIPYIGDKLKFQPEAGLCFYAYDIGAPEFKNGGFILDVGITPQLTYDPFYNRRVRPRLTAGVQLLRSISAFHEYRKSEEFQDARMGRDRKWRIQYQGRFTVSTSEVDFYFESAFTNWAYYFNGKWANNVRYTFGLAIPFQIRQAN